MRPHEIDIQALVFMASGILIVLVLAARSMLLLNGYEYELAVVRNWILGLVGGIILFAGAVWFTVQVVKWSW